MKLTAMVKPNQALWKTLDSRLLEDYKRKSRHYAYQLTPNIIAVKAYSQYCDMHTWVFFLGQLSQRGYYS